MKVLRFLGYFVIFLPQLHIHCFIQSRFSCFSAEHAEADAFFCFTHLMGDIKDNFLKTLDDSACGIGKHTCYGFLSTAFIFPKPFVYLSSISKILMLSKTLCFYTLQTVKVCSVFEEALTTIMVNC